MSPCPVCEAVASASDDTLRTAFTIQAMTIDRLRSSVDTFALAAANARIRELEESLERVNRTRPQSMAVEVARELAATDPRDLESLRCLWCGAEDPERPGREHRKGCTWKRAEVVAERQAKDETKHVVDRWRSA
jgi:hypothetical protein